MQISLLLRLRLMDLLCWLIINEVVHQRRVNSMSITQEKEQRVSCVNQTGVQVIGVISQITEPRLAFISSP